MADSKDRTESMQIETGKNSSKGQQTHTLDEALALIKFGKFNYVVIFFSGLILTTVLLESLGISFIIPIATCDLNLNNQQRGAIGSIAFAGIISSSHLWGFLADTIGRRKMIYPALFIAFTGSFISSFLSNFYLLLIFRFLVGFFVSSGSATIYAYLGEFHSEKIRSRAIMGASTVFGVGCILLPLIAFACLSQKWEVAIPFLGVDYKPWRMYMVVCGLPTLISAIAMFKFPESPKFVFGQGDHDGALEILTQLYVRNTGKEASTYPVKKIIDLKEQKGQKKIYRGDNKAITKVFRKMRDQTLPLFKPPYWKLTLVACLVQFGMYWTSSGMYIMFPDILNRVSMFMEEHPGQQAGLCTIIKMYVRNTTVEETENCTQDLSLHTYEKTFMLEVFYALGFAFIGLIVNKAGKIPILVTILCGTGICGVVATYITQLQWATALFMIFLCCGLAVAVLNAATVDLYPTKIRAMAVCIALMSGRLGSFVGSYGVGAFVETHCMETFLSSSIILIVCGLISLLITRAGHATESKDIPVGNNNDEVPILVDSNLSKSLIQIPTWTPATKKNYLTFNLTMKEDILV